MNEKIKTLAAQTIGENPIYAVAMIMASEEIEKFAKLIIQECIEAVQGESADSGDDWEAGLTMAETAIREHFDMEGI